MHENLELEKIKRFVYRFFEIYSVEKDVPCGKTTVPSRDVLRGLITRVNRLESFRAYAKITFEHDPKEVANKFRAYQLKNT